MILLSFIGEVDRDWDYFKISKQFKASLNVDQGVSELILIVNSHASLEVTKLNIHSAAPSARSLRIQFQRRRHGRVRYR
jgi:hypothetical protein